MADTQDQIQQTNDRVEVISFLRKGKPDDTIVFVAPTNKSGDDWFQWLSQLQRDLGFEVDWNIETSAWNKITLTVQNPDNELAD